MLQGWKKENRAVGLRLNFVMYTVYVHYGGKLAGFKKADLKTSAILRRQQRSSSLLSFEEFSSLRKHCIS
jgi:hypothetical protein